MIPEIQKIKIALVNFESQMEYVIDKAQELQKEYAILQQAYNAVCMERDQLKKELNDRQNTNVKESQ